MEYRGKQYSVVQALEGGLWKWTVVDLEGHIRSGTAPGRVAGIKAAERDRQGLGSEEAPPGAPGGTMKFCGDRPFLKSGPAPASSER